jgi:hypothetical protein
MSRPKGERTLLFILLLPPPPGLTVVRLAVICRLKQQVQQAVQQAPGGVGVFSAVGGAAAPADTPRQGGQQAQLQHGADEQQYIRLPIESAKRLRWFDRQDLTMLMQVRGDACPAPSAHPRRPSLLLLKDRCKAGSLAVAERLQRS